MRRSPWLASFACALASTACGRGDGERAADLAAVAPGDFAAVAPADAMAAATDGSRDVDGGDGCFVSSVGVFGQCLATATCAALGAHVSTPGYCPGPADIQCCTRAPSLADNPPVPPGWKLMPDSAVTPDMTTWAVAILHDPTTYPMFSTTMRTFGALLVLARVEWHPPDFQNSVVHRGVTLYEPG
jgi:hypothetical protein